jgi:hypothetical protein
LARSPALSFNLPRAGQTRSNPDLEADLRNLPDLAGDLLPGSYGKALFVTILGWEEAASIGPPQVPVDASVDVTGLFSLGENAIAKEPGSSYLKPWRCVSRLGL